MIQYITVANVDAYKADWATGSTDAEKDDAVFLANVYLTNQRLAIETEETPAEVIRAGIELAKLALAGKLYDGKGPNAVLSKSVSVGKLTTSTTYADPLVTTSPELDLISALLAPYKQNSFEVDLYRV